MASANPPAVTASGQGRSFAMPSENRSQAHRAFLLLFILAALLTTAVPVSAQGFGLGARFAWVKHDVDVDVDSVRFTGFQMRAVGRRTGLELSLDRHKESFELLNQKVTETPFQV